MPQKEIRVNNIMMERSIESLKNFKCVICSTTEENNLIWILCTMNKNCKNHLCYRCYVKKTGFKYPYKCITCQLEQILLEECKLNSIFIPK